MIRGGESDLPRTMNIAENGDVSTAKEEKQCETGQEPTEVIHWQIRGLQKEGQDGIE